MDKISDTERTETPPILRLSEDECGLPLELFTCGAYLQPYLSLTYLDVLSDVRVRSCLVGEKYPQEDRLWLNQFDLAKTQWSLIGLVGKCSHCYIV